MVDHQKNISLQFSEMLATKVADGFFCVGNKCQRQVAREITVTEYATGQRKEKMK